MLNQKVDGGEYHALIKKDNLKLDDGPYSVNDLSELPPRMQLQSVFAPMNKEVVLFFTKTVLSQTITKQVSPLMV